MNQCNYQPKTVHKHYQQLKSFYNIYQPILTLKPKLIKKSISMVKPKIILKPSKSKSILTIKSKSILTIK